MADVADITQDNLEFGLDRKLDTIRLKASNIPQGTPGKCSICGWDAPRLVKGVCSPCRDRLERQRNR